MHASALRLLVSNCAGQHAPDSTHALDTTRSMSRRRRRRNGIHPRGTTSFWEGTMGRHRPVCACTCPGARAAAEKALRASARRGPRIILVQQPRQVILHEEGPATLAAHGRQKHFPQSQRLSGSAAGRSRIRHCPEVQQESSAACRTCSGPAAALPLGASALAPQTIIRLMAAPQAEYEAQDCGSSPDISSSQGQQPNRPNPLPQSGVSCSSSAPPAPIQGLASALWETSSQPLRFGGSRSFLSLPPQ